MSQQTRRERPSCIRVCRAARRWAFTLVATQHAMRIFLPPQKWDHKIDGPDAGDFFRWMVEYELSHLPPDTIFPRPGLIWETTRDCEVSFEACIAWQGPRFSKLRPPSGEAVTLKVKVKGSVPETSNQG